MNYLLNLTINGVNIVTDINVNTNVTLECTDQSAFNLLREQLKMALVLQLLKDVRMKMLVDSSLKQIQMMVLVIPYL